MSLEQLQISGLAAMRSIQQFRREWDAYRVEIPILARERFWELLGHFRQEVIMYCLNLGRTDGIVDAAREFCRKALTKSGSWNVAECLAFAKTYEFVVRKCERRYAKVFEHLGDTFGDLMDSLPLAGTAVLAWKPTSEAQFRRFVLADVAPSKLAKLILEGENYVALALSDQARHYWLADLLDQQPTEVAEVCDLEL